MPDQADGLLSPCLRRKRMAIVRPYLQGRVLDIGCGVGALSEVVSPEFYFGVDIDEESLQIARKKYPQYRFEMDYPENDRFDTIVLLAVIEHIKSKRLFLESLKSKLTSNGRIVLTTPHPWVKQIHSLGSKIGLFSAAANEEHDQFLDYDCVEKLVAQTGLIISEYKHFLFGTNQLFVLVREIKSLKAE